MSKRLEPRSAIVCAARPAPDAERGGAIVRTAAHGAKRQDFERELQYLFKLHEVLEKRVADPDGHTLLLVTPNNAINATLYDKLNFNFIRDIAPVAGIFRLVNVMTVHPSVPAHTVPEFIAHARANPGKVNFGSGGIGGVPHVAGELFKMMAGVNMLHVPYRGVAPALTDLLSGQVQVMFRAPAASIEYVRSRQAARAGGDHRDALGGAPDIPTVGDFVPGYEASAWFGIGAPKDTPAEIVEKLNKEINAGLADPKMKARLAELGGTCFAARPPTSASSSPTRPRSGAR